MKKIFFLFGFFFIGAVVPVHAELPEKMRENLSDIINDYCHSSIEYSIEDFMGTRDEENDNWIEDGGKAHEFHKKLGCIFDSALKELTEKEKNDVQKAFGTGISLPIETFSLGTDCEDIRLKRIQGNQGDNGFKSKCNISEVEEIKKSYSVCNVTEAVLQEWCGYDMFLYTKWQDEESFFKHYPLAATYNSGIDSFRSEQNKIEEERARTERTIFAALNWYQEIESAATQDAWLVAIKVQLKKINKQWAGMRFALGTFVDKFLNAAIPPE